MPALLTTKVCLIHISPRFFAAEYIIDLLLLQRLRNTACLRWAVSIRTGLALPAQARIRIDSNKQQRPANGTELHAALLASDTAAGHVAQINQSFGAWTWMAIACKFLVANINPLPRILSSE